MKEQREIKYKAFEEAKPILGFKEKMYSWEEMIEIGLDNFFNNPTIILREFTGLLDRNGKEIYDFDYLNCIKKIVTPITDGWGQNDYGSQESVDDYIGRIYYNNERCEYRIDNQKIGDGKSTRNVYEFDELEVIGNVYQTPELIGNI